MYFNLKNFNKIELNVCIVEFDLWLTILSSVKQ